MSTIEETDTAASTVTETEGTETTTTEVEQPATPATETAAAAAPDTTEAAKTGVAALREAFAGELDDAELDALKAGLKQDYYKTLDPVVRAHLRATLRELDAEATAKTEAATKREAEIAKREAELQAQTRAFRQREAAYLALQAQAKDPGAKPELDPFSPESQAKFAEYAAQKAAFDREAPIREKARELAINEKWDALCDKYPDLRDQKVADEFNAFMIEQNKGVDPAEARAGRAQPVLKTDIGARLFFSERAATLARQEAERRQSARLSDQRDAARNIGRSQGGGGPTSRLAAYDNLKKTDPEAAWELLQSDPRLAQEFKARHGYA